DYFRLQAFFAPMQPRDDLPAASAEQMRRYHEQMATWEKSTSGIRAEMEDLIAARREDLRKRALEKFRPEIQQAVRTPDQERTPYQKQIALMAELQMKRVEKDAPLKLPADKKKHYEELEARLAASKPAKLRPLPV